MRIYRLCKDHFDLYGDMYMKEKTSEEECQVCKYYKEGEVTYH